MKIKLLLPSIIGVWLIAGCGDKSSSGAGTNSTSGGGSIATAPADYLNAAVKGQQKAVKVVDTASLNKAIQLFNVDKGRYPKDLNELVQDKFILRDHADGGLQKIEHVLVEIGEGKLPGERDA